MKKTKTEAERDLLAKNHRRLNNEITNLLEENAALRKRLAKSQIEIDELLAKMQRMKQEEFTSILHTALHAMAGNFSLSSDKVAERAIALATEIQLRLPHNDNES